MAGLGLLLGAASSAGKGLARSLEDEQRGAMEMKLMQERARLEEEKTLRIAEATRTANRQAGIQQGRDIEASTAALQNERDAQGINAKFGSQMTAADAEVLRNNPAARQAYGLLAPTRQTDLEDRATAAEKLGYLDAAKETRGQLQTEFVNQRAIKQDENADEARKDEKEWRTQQAALAARREDRMARIAEAELGFRKAQAAKADSQASGMAEREQRMATAAALKGAEADIKQLAKDAADPLLAPEQKQVVMEQLASARREAAQYRSALAGAGLEGSKPTSKPFDPDDFKLGGSGAPAAGAKGKTAANPFGGSTANPAAGEISEPVERKPRAEAKQQSAIDRVTEPGRQAVAGLEAALQQTARAMTAAANKKDNAEVQRLLGVMQQQREALERAKK